MLILNLRAKLKRSCKEGREGAARTRQQRRVSPATNKPAVLVRARQVGLKIPATLVTNDVARFDKKESEALIAKPVAGGDYCYSLNDALAKTNPCSRPAASPAIVQERLVPPEVRIYVIGKWASESES